MKKEVNFRGWKEDKSFRWFVKLLIVGVLLIPILASCQTIDKDIYDPPLYLDPPKDLFEDCVITKEAVYCSEEIERIA